MRRLWILYHTMCAIAAIKRRLYDNGDGTLGEAPFLDDMWHWAQGHYFAVWFSLGWPDLEGRFHSL